MALRCEGQMLDNKNKLAEREAERFLQSVSMTLAHRYEWSGTPLKAGLSPAAAYFPG